MSWKRIRIASATAAAMALAVVGGGIGPAAALADSGAPDALVLGRADGPGLSAIRTAGVDTTRAADAGGIDPDRWDILIVDGDSVPTDALRERPAVAAFVAAGKWVLALDVRPSDHKALTEYTGFDPSDGERSDRSELFAFRVARTQGSPTIEMIDSGPYSLPGSDRLSEPRQRELSLRHVDRVANLIGDEVGVGGGSGAGSARVAKVESVICPPLDRAPDAELQHVAFCWLDAGQEPMPNGYWTEKSNPWWIDWVDNSHAPGKQTANWVVNHRFDVYLNNGPQNPFGSNQTITYAIDGQVNPKTGAEQFFRMDRPADKITSGFGTKRFPERAWWTARIDPKVTPAAATSANLQWNSSHPESPNAETSYSSGEEFNIGFNGTGGNLTNVASGGVSLSYSSSNSKSWTISDWGVENKGSGNDLSWTFSARQPCDVRDTAKIGTKCFGSDGLPSYGPLAPKALSLQQNQFHASGRWHTKKLLTGKDALLKFDIAAPITFLDTYCEPRATQGAILLFNPCYYMQHQEKRVGGAETVAVDAGFVNPVPVKQLKLSPDSADGSKDTKVEGTVVLDRPASIPTVVKIFSDSDNAKVGGPLPGVQNGSQSSITIEPGKSTGTFTIRTNQNKLAPGERTTATITAFYADDTSEPLKVFRPDDKKP